MTLVEPGDVAAAADEIERCSSADPGPWRAAGAQARATVGAAFTWKRCGAETLRAYEDALAMSRRPVLFVY